jgi:hypothetical protein
MKNGEQTTIGVEFKVTYQALFCSKSLYRLQTMKGLPRIPFSNLIP